MSRSVETENPYEDFHDKLALALRRHGYDAVNVREVGRKGLKDQEQLAFAISQQRAILTRQTIRSSQ